MSERSIYITENDLLRLRNLITETRRVELKRTIYIEDLDKELSRAKIVPSDKIPAQTITMNSQAVLLDIEANEEMTMTLVYPQDANMEEGKISVLAPIGTAMIGYSAGDIFEWSMPGGVRQLKILKVIYQPEASGDLNL